MATGQKQLEGSQSVCQAEEEQPSGPSLMKQALGGYECEFVQASRIFQTECSVCLLVLRAPHLASCCGHNFCKECIECVQKTGKCCPLCNGEQFTLTYNRAHDVSLKQFEVYCTNHRVGCEWKGKLETLDDHLNVNPKREKQLKGCAFVEVQCYHNGCGQSFQRRLIAKHQSEECSKRLVSCYYCCDYASSYEDVLFIHWAMCKSFPLPCPNQCTKGTIERQNLEDHLKKECPLQEIECDFKYVGCDAKLPRKDMPGHLKENFDHLTLLARQNQELTAKLLEKDDQIRRIGEESQRKIKDNVELYRRDMERLEQEMNAQVQRLSGDLQTVARSTTSMTEVERRISQLESNKASAVEVKKLRDRVLAVEESAMATEECEKLTHQMVTRRDFEAVSVRLTGLEQRSTKLENNKASAAGVRELKDRVQAIEGSAMTKAERGKLMKQVVTKGDLEVVYGRLAELGHCITQLEGSKASAVGVKKLKDHVQSVEDNAMTQAEREKLTHQVVTKRDLKAVSSRLTGLEHRSTKLENDKASAAGVKELHDHIEDQQDELKEHSKLVKRLTEQNHRDMERLRQEMDGQVQRLLGELQTMTQRMKKFEEGQNALKAADLESRIMEKVSELEAEAEHCITELENNKASAVEVKKLKGRVLALEESAMTKAEREVLTHQLVTRRDFEVVSVRLTGLEQRSTKLENNKASAAGVRELKDRVQAIEGSATTKAEVSRRVAPVQIVMPNFEQHKKDEDKWFSESFYTHPQGYKIRLKVYANGHMSGKGSHVSCYIHLLCGEFDNHLEWPFQGEITIQLLNQHEDCDHRTTIVPFNERTPYKHAARVTSGTMASGWGRAVFIPHSELGYTAATNCQYLMNNCLYFRVRVQLP